MKELGFLGTSLEDIQRFNKDVKQELGYNLSRVQEGKAPNDSKPMKSIGAGVRELRAKDKDGIYRVIYIATFVDFVFVLHCFQKKDEKTRKQDINIAKTRLKKLILEKRND